MALASRHCQLATMESRIRNWVATTAMISLPLQTFACFHCLTSSRLFSYFFTVSDGSYAGPDVHSDKTRNCTNRGCDSCRASCIALTTSRQVWTFNFIYVTCSCSYFHLTGRNHAPAPPPNTNASVEANEEEGLSSVLGLVPHQLRGFLGQFKTMPLVGAAYDRCTGCSEIVCLLLRF